MSSGVKNDPGAIRGWITYDWANSAYATTILAAVLPAYFASEVVGDSEVEFLGRLWTGQDLWAVTVGFGPLIMFLATPILGAIADYSAAKKRFLTVFAVWGALLTSLLFFTMTGDVLLTLGLFLLADIGFVGANVFYDGFLPDLTTDDTIDMVSSRGFAWGYIGGGLHLLLSLILIQGADAGLIPIDPILATRIALGSVGVWWLGFAIKALRGIPETGHSSILPGRPRPGWAGYTRIGFSRTIKTTGLVIRNRPLLVFLVAFILFNDGVQTTIAMASIYATETLDLEITTVIVAVLLVQFVAFFGAMAFGRYAVRAGTRRALLTSIMVWASVSVAAFFLPVGAVAPFLALAVLIGFVLGGTQALSRSLYGSMIPEEQSAEFYGFFSVFSKFSAIWGPWIFALVRQVTGSARWAILSIAIFFVVGGLLFRTVNIEQGRDNRDSLRVTASPT
ncbi:MAG TPA: MFS transporter [Acidimicrobiia bacterium]|nr:MFS transporter [Acidimicrobiia bacterium]